MAKINYTTVGSNKLPEAMAFYDALLSGRQPLGQASMTARRAVMAEEDDPTWLAYTVYGNPAASVDLTENR